MQMSTEMESSLVICEDNTSSAIKHVRKSSRSSKISINYSDFLDVESSEKVTSVDKKSRRKQSTKRTYAKEKSRQSIEHVHECNLDVIGNNAVKLFPIFFSAQNSRHQNKVNVNKTNSTELKVSHNEVSKSSQTYVLNEPSKSNLSTHKAVKKKKTKISLNAVKSQNEILLTDNTLAKQLVVETGESKVDIIKSKVIGADSSKVFPLFGTSILPSKMPGKSSPKLESTIKKRKIESSLDVNDEIGKDQEDNNKDPLKLHSRSRKKYKSASVGAAVLRLCRSRSKSKENNIHFVDQELDSLPVKIKEKGKHKEGRSQKETSLSVKLESHQEIRFKRKRGRPRKNTYSQETPESEQNIEIKAEVKVKKTLNMEKPTTLFPLFTKSHSTIIKNKSIAHMNSKAKKNIGNGTKANVSSLNARKSNPILNDTIVKSAEIKNDNSPRKSVRKVQKSISTKKNVFEIEPETVALSDESVEEINVTDTNKSKKQTLCDDLSKSDVSDSAVIHNIKTTVKNYKNSNSLKSVGTCFSFPLHSHFGYSKSPSKIEISKFVLNHEKDTYVSIPTWSHVTGLTNVKDIIQEKMVDKEIEVTLPCSNGDNTALWTDIKNDYNLKNGISEASISELTSWLLQWKAKFSKGVKIKGDSDDSSDRHSYDSYDSDDDGLANSVILMGPPGSGKTSLVLSLANEHGFKVIEVNASSVRNGRNISHQLKEALESYHVERIAEVNFESKILSNEKNKTDKDKKGTKKGIINYFNKDESSKKGNTKESNVKNFFQVKASKDSSTRKTSVSKATNNAANKNIEDSKRCTISSFTIILFDDIDVVFEEDEGLWSTIRGFLKISKKPVIFTVTRNLPIVKANLDDDMQVLNLEPMLKDISMQKIHSQCQKYCRQKLNLDIDLLTTNSSDFRRNLLHAQFWSQPISDHNSSELLSVNTFLLGSFDHSAANFRSFIFKEELLNLIDLISNYHKIGYDILHSNMFSLFNVASDCNLERKWEHISKKSKKMDENVKNKNKKSEKMDIAKNDSKIKIEPLNGFSPTELWKEACEAFEFKKQALQKGSSSKDLFIFSNILDDFSFSDTLKGPFCKNFKWMSVSERIKQWTTGLPMYNDSNLSDNSDSFLNAASSIQILRLRNEHKKYPQEIKLLDNEIKRFLLEHPLSSSNCTSKHLTMNQLDIISSALPASVCLNKTILNLDYLSALKIMCAEEYLRQLQSGKRSNRFLHYFDSISLLLDKSQIEQISHS